MAAAVRVTCVADVEALKPGNVGHHGDGYGMRAEDFVRSAEAVATVIAAPGITVGERIYRSIRATRAVVDCNTNLGIVLLAAPLVHAALRAAPPRGLRARLQRTLAELTIADAQAAYAAIRLAGPGGMGQAPEHDLQEQPTVTLLEAMRAAAGRDRIAMQYATAYADLFDVTNAWLLAAQARHGEGPWATTMCFLAVASRWPDSLIVRKHGAAVAEEVRARMASVATVGKACETSAPAVSLLLTLDADLKRMGTNPGTSADLTVATLLMQRLDALLRE
ncbi:MAG: triphosphoribosyl-dephospho-CoA synthase [Gammaproteobacteria bacterium]|nr:triphosphoribosyl-dephospho-CoA synthase [Gammaproteobacteria bacterium]